MDPNQPDESSFARAEQWIGRLTLLIGVAGGAVAAQFHSWRWGLGIAIGAVLAWVNFLWLQEGLDALKRISTAKMEAPKLHIPLGTWLRVIARYVLIALVVYVTFVFLKVPILSMVVGLCALGAATMAEGLYEVLRPAE